MGLNNPTTKGERWPSAENEESGSPGTPAIDAETITEEPLFELCRVPVRVEPNACGEETIHKAAEETQVFIDTAISAAREYLERPENERDPNQERLAEELIAATSFLKQFFSKFTLRTTTLQVSTRWHKDQFLSIKLSNTNEQPLESFRPNPTRAATEVHGVEIDFTLNPPKETSYTNRAIKFRLTDSTGHEITCLRLEMHTRKDVPDTQQSIEVDITQAHFNRTRGPQPHKHLSLRSLGTGEESLTAFETMQAVVIFNLTQKLLGLHLRDTGLLHSSRDHDLDLKKVLKAHNSARTNLGMESVGNSPGAYQIHAEKIRQEREAAGDKRMPQEEAQRATQRLTEEVASKVGADTHTIQALRRSIGSITSGQDLDGVPDAHLLTSIVLDRRPEVITPETLTKFDEQIEILKAILQIDDLPTAHLGISEIDNPIITQAADEIKGDNSPTTPPETQPSALRRLAVIYKMVELATQQASTTAPE